MSSYASLRFVAKVALSGGYFVYEELFKTAVAHDTLRFVLNFNRPNFAPDELAELKKCEKLKNVRAEHSLRAQMDPYLEVFRILSCNFGNASVVCFVPTPSSLMVFVGVFGMYIGMVDVPADSSDFPRTEKHDLGHIIVLRPNKIERLSLREAAHRLFVEMSDQSIHNDKGKG